MWYAIIGQDAPDSLGKRMAARPDHLARLQALQDEGRLLLAGPFPAVDAVDPGAAGFTGSLIVAEFASLQAATAMGGCRSLCNCQGICPTCRTTVPESAARMSRMEITHASPNEVSWEE